MAVTAACIDCGDEHPLGDRQNSGGLTTECPACGSPQYRSRATTTVTKSERERIADAVRDIDGVGTRTIHELCDEFDLYAELSDASQTDLKQVEYVGQKTAANIAEGT